MGVIFMRIVLLCVLVMSQISCNDGGGLSIPSSGSFGAPTDDTPPIDAEPPPSQGTLLSWGSGPKQVGDFYYSTNNGEKSPVIILIHGGCWQSDYTYSQLNDLAVALRKHGFSIWNIEYRSLGNGGEWPSMFYDVASAADYLAQLTSRYRLDLSNVVTLGHSAGGHLALWLASRAKIPTNSILYSRSPMQIKAAISLAGIPNLAEAPCFGLADEIIDRQNISEEEYQNRLLETSPFHMLPIDSSTLFVSGDNDSIAPAQVSQGYVDKAQSLGTSSNTWVIEGADHFDLIDPEFIDVDSLANRIKSLMQ